ncbi:MAG: glycerophosphodiester phosphodiesterase [Lentisphaeraceae bacterium]|nr:glycerophosphodiester phosphodiesterase [Lentisphaeraceae bacterium]
MKVLVIIIFLVTGILDAQQIVAHRGASKDAQENSIEAFKLAWKQGADYIEGDFYLTKDKKVVCFHDTKTGRYASRNLEVEKSTWAQLKTLKLVYRKNKPAVSMALLDDVLKTVPHGKGIFIEIKSKKTEIVSRIKRVLQNSKISFSKVHIISFKENILRECKKRLPHIKTQWLVSLKKNKDGNFNYSVDDILKKLKDLEADGVGTNNHRLKLNKTNIARLKSAGYYWNVWTVNNVKESKYLQGIGVDYITTDIPSFLGALKVTKVAVGN